jgi:uncharacterized protein YbjT (DUF2867 family)
MTRKNLLILGATGIIGQAVTRLALDQGHLVTALVRSKAAFEERDGLTLVEGSPLDAEIYDELMPGQDVILSCLGIRREVQTDPWSPVISPTDLTEKSARNAIAAMKRHGVQRILAISAAGVGESSKVTAPELMKIITSSNVMISFQDLQRMEQILQDSGLDTLSLRPVTLTEGAPTGLAQRVDTYEMTSQITKQDVAHYMLEALSRPQPFEHPTEMIASA